MAEEGGDQGTGHVESDASVEQPGTGREDADDTKDSVDFALALAVGCFERSVEGDWPRRGEQVGEYLLADFVGEEGEVWRCGGCCWCFYLRGWVLLSMAAFPVIVKEDQME